MATYDSMSEGGSQSTMAEPRSHFSTRHVAFPTPVTSHTKTFSKRGRADAKTIIEATLRKSAGLLSEFTENTISQTSTFYNQVLSPERFGFSSSPMIQNRRVRPKSSHAKSLNASYNTLLGRKKPDITKLPSSIAEILKEDSNSSIPSMQKSKKYNYHSRKMSLKQRDDFNKEKDHPSSLTSLTENTAPKIVLVSTPLVLQQKSETNGSANNSKQSVDETSNFSGNTMQTKLISQNPEYSNAKSLLKQLSMKSPIKTDKKTVASVNVNVSSVVKKPDIKLNVGVENGVAFILGSKTKSPYFNTFGDADEGQSGEKHSSSSRKWVVNVGNFTDDEISLVLLGNKLTITGFRQPSLNYPEGQSVSETITLPPKFEVNKLKIFRTKDVTPFLVIQDSR